MAFNFAYSFEHDRSDYANNSVRLLRLQNQVGRCIPIPTPSPSSGSVPGPRIFLHMFEYAIRLLTKMDNNNHCLSLYSLCTYILYDYMLYIIYTCTYFRILIDYISVCETGAGAARSAFSGKST